MRPATPAQTIFLLSPAHCGGRRAQLVFRPEAAFALAARLRDGGAPLGDVFSFLSGLYFRGKLAYATAFGRARGPAAGALVIAPGRGLVPPELRVTLDELRRIAEIGVSPDEARFREPLARDAAALASRLRGADRVVLLGSIATGKYTEVLEAALGARLHFPRAFVGRGDMSRGGLMLRHAREARELEYVPVAGAVRHGPRAPRISAMA